MPNCELLEKQLIFDISSLYLKSFQQAHLQGIRSFLHHKYNQKKYIDQYKSQKSDKLIISSIYSISSKKRLRKSQIL